MKTMFRGVSLVVLLVLTACSNVDGASGRAAANTSDPLIVRAHFIGTQQLFADPGSARLKEAWSLPGTVAFRNETLDRLARLPAELLGTAVAKGSPDGSALLRPLLDDLLANESYSDFRATPEMVLAVKLSEARAKAWDANLRQAVAAWKLGTPTAVNTPEGLTGWEVKARGAVSTLQVGRLGDWTIVTAGPQKLTLASTLLGNIKSQGRPAKASGAWLDGDANLARFQGVLPMLANYKNVPTAHFSLSNRADFVRTLVTLDFPKAHGWKAEPWRIPTNSMFDPLASFMAARGVAPVLAGLPLLRDSGLNPIPNQFTGWGLRRLPFQFFYAAPVPDVTNQLKRVAAPLQKTLFGQNKNLVGSIATGTNAVDVYWRGLPLAVPRLFPLRGAPGFLGFEMFPLAATRTRPPKELFQQLSRDNLVYYDWEITEDRIPHWRQMYQLAEIATRRQLTSTNAPVERMLTEIAPKLGESVTEITATSPTQMTLIRKSHVGLTSFEVVTLSRWLESTNFPAFGIFPAQAPKRGPARPSAPQGK